MKRYDNRRHLIAIVVVVDENAWGSVSSTLMLKHDQPYFSSVWSNNILEAKHFADDDDVQLEVLLWMRQQPKSLCSWNWGADKTMDKMHQHW
ncbi:hypothetical protein AVEN_224708-1 [Araneus ventricosus]|uniref:Uncharacterized protein n=1 Tax=Araneus ventricosus TaxID=182803 RepID=A0A4Y2ETZ1_ARAVE|nr:hypothetical protein AVEN_224708-1 [Araneus ventricosus]